LHRSLRLRAISFLRHPSPKESSNDFPVSRRHLLGTGAAFGAAALIPVSLPVSLRAQGKTLVAATFPGTWNEAHREFLAPAFTKRTGASVTQSILLGTTSFRG
jgi:hypothetical protein